MPNSLTARFIHGNGLTQRRNGATVGAFAPLRLCVSLCLALIFSFGCAGASRAQAQTPGLSQAWPEEPNAQYILFASGTLQGEQREYEVPVEAKTFRLQFWARLTGELSFDVVGPLGKSQTLTDPNVSSTISKERQSLVVFDPKPGLWRVRLSGSGTFTAAVSTQSELYICCMSLLSSSGPQGHPLPPTVQLRSRQQAMQLSLAGIEVLSVGFDLIDENNRVIKPVKLRQNDYSNPYLMIMLVETSTQPFRVMARGEDHTGYAFQRVFPTLFQPPIEEGAVAVAQDQLLADLIQNAEAGPYRVVRASVLEMTDEVLLSEAGAPIGVRLKFALRFPRDGFYTPLPQVFPERIAYGYTGALSLRVQRVEIAPFPEGPQSTVTMRYLSRASYRANQLYRFTVDLVPNYAQYNDQKHAFCIMTKAFSYGSRDRFLNEVTNEARMRFRISIMGTDMDGRQPATTEQSYIPNLWYSSFLKEGAAECQ